jgi:hypothetical protein
MEDVNLAPAIVGTSASMPVQLAELVAQRAMILRLMRDLMKEQEHFGTVPGAKNPTLWQPGARLVATMFNLRVHESVEKIERLNADANGWAELSVLMKVTLRRTAKDDDESGPVVGEAYGYCSSSEEKFRYRWVPCDAPPPESERAVLIATKRGKWMKLWSDKKPVTLWHRKELTDNMGELEHSIIRRAAKRALVAAIMNATAAGEIFYSGDEDEAPRGEEVSEADVVEEAKPPKNGAPRNGGAPDTRPPAVRASDTAQTEGWDLLIARSGGSAVKLRDIVRKALRLPEWASHAKNSEDLKASYKILTPGMRKIIVGALVAPPPPPEPEPPVELEDRLVEHLGGAS